MFIFVGGKVDIDGSGNLGEFCQVSVSYCRIDVVHLTDTFSSNEERSTPVSLPLVEADPPSFEFGHGSFTLPGGLAAILFADPTIRQNSTLLNAY